MSRTLGISTRRRCCGSSEWRWPRIPYLGPRTTNPIPRTVFLVPIVAAVVVILGVL
jgi:hypothetical protein